MTQEKSAPVAQVGTSSGMGWSAGGKEGTEAAQALNCYGNSNDFKDGCVSSHSPRKYTEEK